MKNKLPAATLLLALLNILVFVPGCKGTKESTGQSHFLIGGESQPMGGDFAVKLEFHNALAAKMLGNFEEATYMFNQVLKLDPEHHASMYELAKIYFETKKNSQALQYAANASKLDKSNTWYKELYAKILATTWDYSKAAEVYNDLIEINPKMPEYYFELAFMYEQSNKTKEAIQTYNQLEKIIGIDENVIMQKHRLYLRINDIKSAAAEIEKLIENFPANLKYLSILSEIYEINNMPDKAFQVYERMIEKDSANPEALFALARYHKSKNEFAKYRKYIKQAFENPSLSIDVKIGYLLGYVDKVAEDEQAREEAFMLAKMIIKAHKEQAKAYAMYGDLLYNANMLEESLVQYRKSFNYNNGVFTVWQQVFFINSTLRQFDSLDKATLEALELFPNQPIPYLFNGIAKTQLKQYNGAIKMFEQALMIATGNRLLESDIYANMGDTYHSMGNHIASDTCYENSLKRNPENVVVLNNYSYYLSLRGEKLDQAEEMAAKANKLAPSNVSFQDTYAWVLFKKNKLQEARIWIEKAIQNGGESSAVILEHFGDILFKQGEKELAIEYWIKAKEKGGDSENLGKKIENKQWYE